MNTAGTQFRVHKELSDSLRKDWEELWKNSPDTHIVSSPYWFLAALDAFPSTRPRIIEVRGRDGKLLAVAPFVGSKMYGLKVFFPPAMEFADRTSILADMKNDALMQGLFKECRKLGVAVFRSLHEDEYKQIAQNTRFITSFATDRNCSIDVPAQGIFGDLSRGKIRSLEQKKKRFPAEVSFQLTDGNDSETLEKAFALDMASVKHARGKGVFWRPDVRKFYSLLAKHAPEHFFVGLLHSGDEPAAYTLGFVKSGVYMESLKAHTEKFVPYRPGGVLFIEFLKAVEQKHPEEISLGRGCDDFKSDFTKNVRIVHDCVVSESRLIRQYLFVVHRLRDKAYALATAHPRLYLLYKRLRGFPATNKKP